MTSLPGLVEKVWLLLLSSKRGVAYVSALMEEAWPLFLSKRRSFCLSEEGLASVNVLVKINGLCLHTVYNSF